MITIAAVIRRELLVFSRYPSWILSMLIWPLLFPLVYLLGSRALTGPGGEGLPAFVRATGTEVRPIAGNGGQPGHAVGGHLVRGVFMVFAGICFPLSVLPGWMRTAAAYLPLTHTIEGARAALLSGAGIADLRP
ncbi:MAG TPA: ABC transporter permease, partial [bacterium]